MMINGPAKSVLNVAVSYFNQANAYIAAATDAVMGERRIKMIKVISEFKSGLFCIKGYSKEIENIFIENGLEFCKNIKGIYSNEKFVCFLNNKVNINPSLGMRIVYNNHFIKTYKEQKLDDLLKENIKGKKIVMPRTLEEFLKYYNKQPEKIKLHMEICKEMTELYERKNNDYGDSFSKLRTEIPNAILFRIYDKYSRLKTLMEGTEQQVKEESIDDTLIDLANYCILELIERRTNDKERD